MQPLSKRVGDSYDDHLINAINKWVSIIAIDCDSSGPWAVRQHLSQFRD